MHIGKYYQKRLLVSLLSVMAIISVISVSIYVIARARSNAQHQIVNVGDLRITHIGGSENITIDNIIPMIDAIAKDQTNNIYSFSIRNTGEYVYRFQIILTDNHYIPAEFIRYTLNQSSPRRLADGAIFEGQINPGKTQNFKLQIWVGSGNQNDATIGLPNEIIGSELNLKINIEAKERIEI